MQFEKASIADHKYDLLCCMFNLHVCAPAPDRHPSSDLASADPVLIQKCYDCPIKFTAIERSDLLSAVASQHKSNQGTIQPNITH